MRPLLLAALFLGATLFAQDSAPGISRAADRALQAAADAQDDAGISQFATEAELLEKSRQAGLLTDWHLEGRYGHSLADLLRPFAPEKEAARQGAHRFERRRYELVFPVGTFALPAELASARGVFYALSTAYLTGGGEWIVYLESPAEAIVFVDGRRVLARESKGSGVLRARVHIESGYHSVMVKFIAQAAPFRVAILPPNSGSRRKNNTPYLQASPASEDMMARALRPVAAGF